MSDSATRSSSALAPVVAGGDPLTTRELETRLARIQDVMRTVMQKDVDYGVIPGTQKPTLFKPGAEKLIVTFKLAASDPQIVEVIDDKDQEIRYRVRVPILTAAGQVVAVGVGECSSLEEKYKWRRPVHAKDYEAAPADRKREKYQRNGDVWQQVRVEPADVANTVLKMAHKRAYIHAAIMATAASSIFTQDIEDRPEGMEDHDDHDQRREPPQSRTQTSSQQGSQASGSSQGGNGGPTISEPQDKRLFAIAKGKNVSLSDVKSYLERTFPYTNGDTRKIRRADYDAIVDAVEAGLRG